MLKLSYALILFGLVQCTSKLDINPEKNPENIPSDYFVFGRVGGFCAAPCDRVYKIENEQLFQDLSNCLMATSPCPSDFNKLSQQEYESVKDLKAAFPGELFGKEDKEKYCKSCAYDGVDVYVEFYHQGQKKFWVINPDQSSPRVRAFVRLAFEKLQALEE
ncbi:MAG: hypothetical protein NW226_18520 [Microscillaceae bacterium]|nr:hypothetical protein [Microscillaceae bacterium]